MTPTPPGSAAPPALTYRDAGVDIDAGDALVDRIRPYAARTLREGVLAGIGGFGALFEVPRRYREPVLVAGTDGVGTKLKLAFALGRHDTIGIDLVAMSANDVLVQGAEPLFFLDYYATGRLEVPVAAEVVRGIARGCELAGCALIGGETAEMPGLYAAGEYDLAGFCVGVVEKRAIIDGRDVRAGDRVIGIASSGVHSNGYSLVRRIVERTGIAWEDDFHGRPFADVLLEPTRIYVRPVLQLIGELPVKALAHITGGGLVGNVPRVLPEGLAAELDAASWSRPPIFDWLAREGGVREDEMLRTFNCGLGMIAIVRAEDAERAVARLRELGETASEVGRIRARDGHEPATLVR